MTGVPYGRPSCVGGVFAGVAAALPALAPLLVGGCLSCLGLGGAALGGAAFAFPAVAAFLAGTGVLVLSAWRSVRRARQASGTAAGRGLAVRVLLLAATAVASYLLVTSVVGPVVVRALMELGGALGHRP